MSTVNKKEIEKFSKIADDWWNPEGKFKPLHKFNPLRISYIKEKVIAHFNIRSKLLPFKNIELLDIGCGGGLLSEPMCRLGAKVTAIDASLKNINVDIGDMWTYDISEVFHGSKLLKTKERKMWVFGFYIKK